MHAPILLLTLAATTSPMQTLAADYLAARWRSSPIEATLNGEHGGDVDRHLDDRSAGARARRSAWLRDFAARLATVEPTLTDPQDRADAELLQSDIALERLDLDEIGEHARNPDEAIATVGDIFFMMATQPYAPLPRRCADLAARLAEVPRFLDQARAELTRYEPARAAAAIEDGAGAVDAIKDLPATCKTVNFAAMQKRATRARAAVDAFITFVQNDLPQKPRVDFRLGPALYAKRFGPYLQTERTPDEVLAAAQKRLVTLHAEMATAARKLLTDAKHVTTGDDRTVTKRALDLIGADHPAAAEYFAMVKASLADAQAFVRAHGLLTLDARQNLSVQETPEFMRAGYGVAAFSGAPTLQPELGAFYYFTPFPTSWTPAQLESKLREYNRWMLDILTIHEAMPGHYVQFEHANDLQPTWRRTLRALLASTAYVEGWACYAQDLLVDAGFRDRDPRLFLSDRKMELRAVLNTILDVSLQAHDMTDDAALHLLMDDGFQERAEAEGKLRRAKLSVTQLDSYFVGYEEWKALRQAAEAQPGFDLRRFHDHALGQGPVTFASLRALLHLK